VTSFTAHKYYLAAASPVFSTQFFGSLQEEGTVITLTDVTARAFKAMLEFVYGQNVTTLEASSVMELFEALYVANKYMIEKMTEFVEDKLEMFKLSTDNVGEAAKAALSYKCFPKASCNILQRFREFTFGMVATAEEVFGIAEHFESEDLMKTVLLHCLQIICHINANNLEFFWFGYQTGIRICSNQAMPKTLHSVAKSLVGACVYEFQRKESQAMILMSAFSSGTEREKSLLDILKVVKNNFCANCDSSPCQDGKWLVFQRRDVKEGCKVQEVTGLKRTGIVIEGTFKRFDDMDKDDLDENYFNANIHYANYYKVKITEDTVIFACQWSLQYNCK